MENATKELAILKQQVPKAVAAATALKIKTAQDMIKATDILGKIKSVGKMVRERMEAPVKIAYKAYKDVKTEQDKVFGSFVRGCDEAESIVKGKMIEYQDIEVAKAEKKTEQIEKKVEDGKMSFEKAADKIIEATPQKNVTTDNGAVQFRTVKEVVIEDESKLPREYLIPDMAKIKKVALAGVEISGVKVIDKRIVAGITH